MNNNKYNIINYDITKLKINIKRMLDDRRITQGELGKKIGMSQPRISAILNPENSNCFTVPQLVSIAMFLEISVDDLLGIKPAQNNSRKKCIADVLEKLFEINDIIPIEFDECRDYKAEKELDDCFLDEYGRTYKTCISFDNSGLELALSHWSELQKCSLEVDLKKGLIEMWKDETIKKLK